MKPEYLSRITKLLHGARPRLARTHGLAFKNFFGAVAGYVNGKFFISCGRFGVALKLPPRKIGKLLAEKGVRPLKYFPNGHIKKDYVVLPRRMLEDKIVFKRLVDTSFRFVNGEMG